jgi:uncharacterized protein YegL
VTERPGGALARRPLHFFFVVDTSGSMGFDGKIQALNTAVREALPAMREVAQENPESAVYVRVLEFSDGARWKDEAATPLEAFRWADLTAGGVTDLGRAIELLAEELQQQRLPERGLPPVIVLISDGQPTDDYRSRLDRLLALPWAAKAVRIAIAIGRDADHAVLEEFMANPEFRPLTADNPEALVARIRWASTAAIGAASRPTGSGRPIVALPPDVGIESTPIW